MANVRSVRYEPNENVPKPLAIGLACQYAILLVAAIVLTPVIVVRAAGGDDGYMQWAAFAALLVSGITTLVQAVGYKRVGAGHILFMGPSGTFIAISITALAQGGPGLLASLVIASSVIQFISAYKLSWFRRIFTPMVSGTIVMLVAVAVMPIFFGMLDDVPEGSSSSGAPICAIITLLTTVGIVFRSSGVLRLWAPVIGVAVGSVASALLGLFDTSRIAVAPWVGLPVAGWPGLSLDFSPSFWLLLPSFIFVTIIDTIETVGDTVAVQRVSWRKPRSIDFKSIQGAIFADGLGNLLSGLASTVASTTYSTGISLVELTGVAARRVGIWIGVVLVLLALSPKLTSVIMSIPNPVAGAFLGILIAMLFVVGMRMVIQDGDYRKCLVAAIGFWLGYGFHGKIVFPDHLQDIGRWQVLLQDGMVSGGLVAILLLVFLELLSPRRATLKIKLDVDNLPKIHSFLSEVAAGKNWSKEAILKLCSAGEETILSLLDRKATDKEPGNEDRYLFMRARGNERLIELECVADFGEENLEDKMVLLKERSELSDDRELSLRILKQITSSFQHHQYHNTDIVTFKVDAQA